MEKMTVNTSQTTKNAHMSFSPMSALATIFLNSLF